MRRRLPFETEGWSARRREPSGTSASSTRFWHENDDAEPEHDPGDRVDPQRIQSAMPFPRDASGRDDLVAPGTSV